MSDGSKLPLRELRRRLEASRDPRTRRRLAEELATDTRQGARALGAWVLRQEESRRLERRRLSRLLAPTRRARREGAHAVAGVDEVGVGPLAGPVVAAVVVSG